MPRPWHGSSSWWRGRPRLRGSRSIVRHAVGDGAEHDGAVRDRLVAGNAQTAAQSAAGLNEVIHGLLSIRSSQAWRAARARAKVCSSAAASPRSSARRSSPQFRLVGVEFGQQGIAIGEADVAPHFRVAAGDAREIAKAAGGEAEQLSRNSWRCASSCTSAKASRCGRWLTAANTRSCSSGVMSANRGAARFPGRAHRAPTSAGAFSGSGVSTTLRPR